MVSIQNNHVSNTQGQLSWQLFTYNSSYNWQLLGHDGSEAQTTGSSYGSRSCRSAEAELPIRHHIHHFDYVTGGSK